MRIIYFIIFMVLLVREKDQKYIFNIKAGYADQAEALIKMSVYSLGVKDVCIFYQDDAIGNSGRQGTE